MADVQWNTIKDFSPGIHATISSNTPPGAAVPSGTFGCYSPQNGVLSALPRLSRSITPPTPATYPFAGIENEEYRVAGLHVVGPVFYGPNNTVGEDTNQSEIYLAFTYDVDTGANHNHVTEVHRYHRNWVTPSWSTIKVESRSFSGDYVSTSAPDNAEFVSVRSNHADSGTVGAIVTAFCSAGVLFMFPDETTPTVDSTAYLMGDKDHDTDFALRPVGGTNVVGHQGRLVYFYLTVNGSGANAFWATNEQFFWSAPNDINTLSPLLGSKFGVTAQYADPTGYECMASLTADELLLIKSRGGAIVIRGDLDDPTIVTYPYVRSPGNSNDKGIATQLGYVYPVDGGGVWLWSGGQVSEHLTPHLAQDFWRPPRIDTAGAEVDFDFNTQCAQAGDLVMFPNNWVWDTNSAKVPQTGWWQIDNPTDRIIHRWATDWRGIYVYGTPSGFTATDQPAIYEYDLVTPRDTYQWTSHPMSPSLETEVRLESMVVVGSGIGTVTVRAFTGEDPLGQTVDFEIAGTNQTPTFTEQRISVLGTELSFEVVSAAANSDDPAPVIHELRYALTKANYITNVD